jgi:transcriptional regulator with XRE-family HTH domain
MLTVKLKKRQKTNVMTVLKILNVSQAELARMLNVNKSIISRWLTGITAISPRMAMRLSHMVPEIPPQEFCPYLLEDEKYVRK